MSFRQNCHRDPHHLIMESALPRGKDRMYLSEGSRESFFKNLITIVQHWCTIDGSAFTEQQGRLERVQEIAALCKFVKVIAVESKVIISVAK